MVPCLKIKPRRKPHNQSTKEKRSVGCFGGTLLHFRIDWTLNFAPLMSVDTLLQMGLMPNARSCDNLSWFANGRSPVNADRTVHCVDRPLGTPTPCFAQLGKQSPSEKFVTVSCCL
jgi:hypothetical protein